MTTPHIGTSSVYGNQKARTSFTPEQQAVMDAGGNYGGYAVVDGHFTYVGAGLSGQAAYDRVYGTSSPTAAATPTPLATPADTGMTGTALASGSTQAPAQDQAQVDPLAADVQHRRDDAFAMVSSLLAEYGLESLSGQVRDWVQQDMSPAEISFKLRDTPQFKAEFPEIEMRHKAGLPAISAGDVISYRKRAAELFQAAGLPQGFHDDKSDYTRFIAGDVSLAELSDRINLAAQAAYKAPQEVRDSLAQWGMGPGDLTAFWLNPDTAQPLLERKLAAAQIAGASRRTGFGALDEQQATNLAQLGVSQDQAQQGFGQLQQSHELFGALDQGETTIARDEQIGATFAGNTLAQQRIQQRAQRRKAAFEESGGFASSGKGIVGLGAAQ